MKNVVITGVGIKSCLGNDYNDVLVNLQEGKSGISFNETYSEFNYNEGLFLVSSVIHLPSLLKIIISGEML